MAAVPLGAEITGMYLGADFDISVVVPVVAGGAHDKADEANACAGDGISNPDNIVVLASRGVLIGKDTGNHENNAM